MRRAPAAMLAAPGPELDPLALCGAAAGLAVWVAGFAIERNMRFEQAKLKAAKLEADQQEGERRAAKIRQLTGDPRAPPPSARGAMNAALHATIVGAAAAPMQRSEWESRDF